MGDIIESFIDSTNNLAVLLGMLALALVLGAAMAWTFGAVLLYLLSSFGVIQEWTHWQACLTGTFIVFVCNLIRK